MVSMETFESKRTGNRYSVALTEDMTVEDVYDSQGINTLIDEANRRIFGRFAGDELTYDRYMEYTECNDYVQGQIAQNETGSRFSRLV